MPIPKHLRDILDEGAVSEAAREPLSDAQLRILIRGALAMAQRVIHARFCDPHPTGQAEACKSTTEAIVQLDALCATVKQLRTENERLSTGLINLYHVITSEQCDRVAALGMATSAVSQLLSKLAQVKQERDDADNRAKETQANVEHLTSIIFANRHAHYMRSRAIQLCKDKAAEWEATSEYDDATAYKLVAELEKL